GHLPHGWGDYKWRDRRSPANVVRPDCAQDETSHVKRGASAQAISPPVGEMPGRAEGG
ncbi:Hypothetical protein, partial CDS, partial [Neorhizobium galegae bv. officinalis]